MTKQSDLSLNQENHCERQKTFEECTKKRTYNRKRKIVRRNALKHGLSIPVTHLPYFRSQIEAWHRAILDDLSNNYILPNEPGNQEFEIVNGARGGVGGVGGVEGVRGMDCQNPESFEAPKLSITIVNIAYELAVQICELRRIAELKRLLSSERLGPSQKFSNKDIIHLITIVEGFTIPPNKGCIPFDDRAMSMLYRIFGIRRGNSPSDTVPEGWTPHQIKRLASLERYEERASIRMKKAVRRLSHALSSSRVPGDEHDRSPVMEHEKGLL